MDRFEQRAYDVFNKKFEEALSQHNNNHRNTFDTINDRIEKETEFRVFNSYESFKNARSRRKKKK